MFWYVLPRVSLKPLWSECVWTPSSEFSRVYKITICPLKYPDVTRYSIKGTVNPRCWHLSDDAILFWIPLSGVGLVMGAKWFGSRMDSLGALMSLQTRSQLEGELFKEQL